MISLTHQPFLIYYALQKEKSPPTYIAKNFDGLITVFENLFSIFPSTTYLDKNFDFDKLFEKLFSQFLSEHGTEGFSALLLSIWTEIRS